MLTAIKILKSLIAVALLVSNSIYAQENLINVNPNNQVTIHGYDPVAYFIAGKADFKHKHENVTWQFNSRKPEFIH